MKSYNLSKFVLRVATALVVLALPTVLLVSLLLPVWAAGGNTADLSITKEAVPDDVKVGQELTYTIKVTNNGPAVARDVTVADRLPYEVSVKKVTSSSGSCDVVVGLPICDVGDLDPGKSAIVTIVVTVNELPSGGTLVNKVTTKASDNEGDPTGNNAAYTITGVVDSRQKSGNKPSGIVTGGGTTKDGEGNLLALNDGRTVKATASRSIDEEVNLGGEGGLLALNDGRTVTATASRSIDEEVNLGGEGGLLALNDGRTVKASASRGIDEEVNLGGEGGLLALNDGKTVKATASRSIDEEVNLGGEGGLLALNDGKTVTATASRGIDEEVNLGGEGGLLALNDGRTVTATASRSIDEEVNLGGEGGLLALNDGRTVKATASRGIDEEVNLGGEGGLLALNDGKTVTATASRSIDEEVNLGGEGGLLALNDGKTVTATASRSIDEEVNLGGDQTSIFDESAIVDDSAGGKGPNDIILGSDPDPYPVSADDLIEDSTGGERTVPALTDDSIPGGEGEVILDEVVTTGGNVSFGGGDVDIFDDDGTGDFDDDSEWSKPEDKIKPPPDDLIDITKDLPGGGKLTDDGFPCPKPPADYPINVGSKMKVGTGIGKMAGGLAKGLLGGLGGGFGGGGRGGGDDFFDSDEGPETSRDPIKKKHKTKFTDADTGTKIRVGAIATDDGLLFSTHIDKAPGKGTFQTVFLEDNDGRRMLPVRYYVYKIWVKITITVSWTRSTYVDGKLVKRESGGWSESWTKDLGTFVHRELGEMPVEGQPIWRRMGYGRAAQGVRCLGTEFPITVDQLQKTGPVSLVIHITRPKQSPVTTVPFIIQASVNKDGDIELTQIEQTPATARCK